MKTLARYVSVTVLFAILTVLAVVVALDVMSAIIDGVGDIQGEFTFVEVIKYVITTLPGRIYQNIPFSALIGCLIGLGILSGNSELTVMRAAGISLLRIVGFVLRPVLVIIAIGVLLGEFAVPYSDQLAEGRKALLRGGYDKMASASGLWNKENNEFVHVNVMLPNGKLFGVTRYRFQADGNLSEVSFASQALYVGSHWQEEKVVATHFEGDTTRSEDFTSRPWDSELSPDLLRLVLLEPDSLPMAELYRYGHYLEAQGQSADRHWLAFWVKVLQPGTTAALVLIAVSFIFGPLRSATMGFRIFAGVITGIAFSTSQQLLGPASLVFGFAPIWAVLAPILLCFGVGAVLLRRAA